ncbi:hypothetical protein ACFX14_041892 [Malus domestica]
MGSYRKSKARTRRLPRLYGEDCPQSRRQRTHLSRFFQLGLPLRSSAQLSFLGFLPVLQFYTNQFHNLVESQEQHSTKAPFFIALRDITTSTESRFTTSSREAPGSGLRILGTF